MRQCFKCLHWFDSLPKNPQGSYECYWCEKK